MSRLVQYLAELRPVADAAAFGFVDVLPHNDVSVPLRVVAQGPELGGDRKIDVLSVAGDTGVEGGAV